MNRADVEREFTVVDGIIRDPGKFELTPVYTPYFYDAYLNGMSDEDDGETLTFYVNEDDKKEFPELKDTLKVFLVEDDSGFIRVEEV